MKKLLCVLVFVLLMITLVPTMALAVGEHTTQVDSHYYLDSCTWNEFTGNGGCLSEGFYYLTDDVKLVTPIYVQSGKVCICLNGHSISIEEGSAIVIEKGADLYLEDCEGTGKITGGNGCYFDGYSVGGAVYNKGTFNMYGGDICGNTADYGAGVYNEGIFNMHGGCICDNKANYGGGIYNLGDLNITGGTIKNNEALAGAGILTAFYDYVNTMNISGDTVITENIAKEAGGGIYNYDTNMNITGNVKITNNEAEYGGGIYNAGDYPDTTTIIDGNVLIKGNKAQFGAGINNSTWLEIYDATITGNFVLNNDTGYKNLDITYGGAGIDWCENTLVLGGKVKIFDNYTNTLPDNLYMEFAEYLPGLEGSDLEDLDSIRPVIVNANRPLTDGAKIGFNYFELKSADGVLPVALTETDVTKYFIPDNSSDELIYYKNYLLVKTEQIAKEDLKETKDITGARKYFCVYPDTFSSIEINLQDSSYYWENQYSSKETKEDTFNYPIIVDDGTAYIELGEFGNLLEITKDEVDIAADDSKATFNKFGGKVTFEKGSSEMVIEDCGYMITVPLAKPVITAYDRIYIPLRNAFMAYGYVVEYDAATSTVSIW